MIETPKIFIVCNILERLPFLSLLENIDYVSKNDWNTDSNVGT